MTPLLKVNNERRKPLTTWWRFVDLENEVIARVSSCSIGELTGFELVYIYEIVDRTASFLERLER